MADLAQSAALLTDEEKKKQLEAQQGSSNVVPSGGTGVVNGTGGAVSTAGVGAGGLGGWTNIQSYLNANKSDTGSADALKNTVGTDFNNEKNRITTESDKFKNDTQKDFDEKLVTKDKANSIIDNAAQAYQYSGAQNDAYYKSLDPVKNAMTQAYSGPSSYSTALSDQTQRYGAGLKDNGGFDQVMSQVYGKAANAPLSRGQFSLQKQLDVNNQALADTRNQLSTDYDNLVNNKADIEKNTTNYLTNLRDTYNANQNALKDHLFNQRTAKDQAQIAAENAARAGYNNDYNSGSSLSSSRMDYSGPDGKIIWRDDGHKNLGNATWAQVEDEFGLNPFLQQQMSGNLSGYGQGYRETLERAKRNADGLNNFFISSDEKYKNAGDAEKRQWNVISDILGDTQDRKKQGFKVRG